MNPLASAGQPEYDGRSVGEAVDRALKEQALTAKTAEVTVLDKGSRGFLGLGARPARVRVEPKVFAGHPLSEVALELLRKMGIEGSVSARQKGKDVLIDIRTGDADGALIGRKGETLAALQHVMSRAAGRVDEDIDHVRVDVAGYQERREAQLAELALELAHRVESTGRRAMTEPLSPAERRIVHRALENREGIRTHVGAGGVQKRVILTSRGKPGKE